ncbi:MAG: hypothetical protein ABIP93_06690 [Gemmatimonadaceae bacterium]
MSDSSRRWLPATVAVLALAACITSLGHDFTYDDRYAILMNDRVHSLKSFWRFFQQSYWLPQFGGDGYRPVVLLLFAVQWVIGHGAAWVFHLGNIVLAVATALAVYWMALAVLPKSGAWLTAALFAVHPVHVEVTGNMVGQAELVVGLGVALGMGWYLRRRRDGELRWRDVWFITLLYAVAMFSKEHAIVFPALIVAAEFTVVRDERSWRARVATFRPLLLLLIAVSAAYLYARSLVQADFAGFAPYAAFRFLNMDAAARIGTMMHEFPRIGQLMIFPTRLSADYSPPDVYVATGIGLAEAPGLLIALGTIAVAFALRRRAPVASFGLFWFLLAYAPVSNILIPTGIVTAERTLFLPSMGVVLVMATAVFWIAAQLERRGQIVMAAGVAVLLTLGVWKSVERQQVWRNNDVLFDRMVVESPNNYRAHILRGRNMAVKRRLQEMEREFRKGIHLFPYDAGVTVDVAESYRRAGLCEPAIPLYEWSFALDSTYRDGRLGYVYCLSTQSRWVDTRHEALRALRYGAYWEGKYLRNAVYVADSALGRPLRKPPPPL